MKKLIVIWAVVLAPLLLVASVGCQKQWQPEEPLSLAIMVESNIVEAGSSFMVSGSNFNPKQWVFAEFEYRFSNGRGAHTTYDEADEQGSIHLTIKVPEDVVPGDYEVEISTGATKLIKDRQLIATLPIHVQARAE